MELDLNINLIEGKYENSEIKYVLSSSKYYSSKKGLKTQIK